MFVFGDSKPVTRPIARHLNNDVSAHRAPVSGCTSEHNTYVSKDRKTPVSHHRRHCVASIVFCRSGGSVFYTNGRRIVRFGLSRALIERHSITGFPRILHGSKHCAKFGAKCHLAKGCAKFCTPFGSTQSALCPAVSLYLTRFARTDIAPNLAEGVPNLAHLWL